MWPPVIGKATTVLLPAIVAVAASAETCVMAATPGFTEGVEELRQRLAVSTRRGPHQPATVVIHDESDVSVPALVADLVDPDPSQPGQRVSLGGALGHDPGDDRPDRAPRDSQQLLQRRLRGPGRQPRDRVLSLIH